MATAQLIWNQERDACIITWSYKPTDYPLNPINTALAKFYNTGKQPFIYEAYNGDRAEGLLMAASMELEDNEIDALYRSIKTSHEAAPQSGEWEAQEFNV